MINSSLLSNSVKKKVKQKETGVIT